MLEKTTKIALKFCRTIQILSFRIKNSTYPKISAEIFKNSIHACDNKYFICSKSIITKIEKAVKLFLLLNFNYIKGDVYIPPAAVKVDSIPSMMIVYIINFCSVNNVARDVMTSAEGSEQMSKIITNTFLSSYGFVHIKILDNRFIFIVILKIMYHPFIYCFYLFFISIAVGTNFVSEFYCL